ncbi:Endonuclease, Uma2 family (restriction endonuclease fold) [Methylobacterium sp. 174MFSha1.1]|uniref:Uma2 family endonuclease n=1 Tax=Methylobacterium sp. 174MFSha1.1 TaxID=1502749 RepID=UPI0008F0B46E|nr:Uma2 family endonuclease [Methylobacterium sp. 174MFSha1.1]SFU32810.1 Endonuclease, Uma2 family (restriction endonuclease fold) [Methylobacterium sp. 174MFSha1.1]
MTMQGRLSPAAFRSFQDGRPDEERWELIDGTPVMMTPPLIDHNRIASTLERLLNDALERHDPDREAVQRVGLELGLGPAALAGLGFAGAYRPEPDVAVIDYDPAAGRRFVDRAYLLAEVVSGTDDEPVLPGGLPWIDAKTRLYRAHEACRAVLVIEQRRIEVTLWRRGPDGWDERRLTDADAALDLPEFGLHCPVGALYAGTHLRPRRRS